MKIKIYRKDEIDTGRALPANIFEAEIEVPAKSEDQLMDRWPTVRQILVDLKERQALNFTSK